MLSKARCFFVLLTYHMLKNIVTYLGQPTLPQIPLIDTQTYTIILGPVTPQYIADDLRTLALTNLSHEGPKVVSQNSLLQIVYRHFLNSAENEIYPAYECYNVYGIFNTEWRFTRIKSMSTSSLNFMLSWSSWTWRKLYNLGASMFNCLPKTIG